MLAPRDLSRWLEGNRSRLIVDRGFKIGFHVHEPPIPIETKFCCLPLLDNCGNSVVSRLRANDKDKLIKARVLSVKFCCNSLYDRFITIDKIRDSKRFCFRVFLSFDSFGIE